MFFEIRPSPRPLTPLLGMLLLLFAAVACRNAAPGPLQETFYHWQTELEPDSTERALLFGHDRLYVKAFDVVWEAGAARPAAEIRLVDTVGLPELVPVIFITNEVIRHTPDGEISRLARDISDLLRTRIPQFPELQIDCDWTAQTQVQYFHLLRAMREQWPERRLTCTVRLHQYRDRKVQGIPPVERATLMAYNTGNLGKWETDNSIVDSAALAHYLGSSPPYPLPLDIAVAVYDWAVVYRRGELVQLINEPDLTALGISKKFTRLSATRYRADTTTYLNGTLLYRDDLIRHEVAAPGRVEAEAARLRGYVGAFAGQRLLVYRLGSRLLRD